MSHDFFPMKMKSRLHIRKYVVKWFTQRVVVDSNHEKHWSYITELSGNHLK